MKYLPAKNQPRYLSWLRKIPFKVCSGLVKVDDLAGGSDLFAMERLISMETLL